MIDAVVRHTLACMRVLRAFNDFSPVRPSPLSMRFVPFQQRFQEGGSRGAPRLVFGVYDITAFESGLRLAHLQ